MPIVAVSVEGDKPLSLGAYDMTDGAPRGRPGGCVGLKKQKSRPKAAANDDDDLKVPHLFSRCLIVHRFSAIFFNHPSPWGGVGVVVNPPRIDTGRG